MKQLNYQTGKSGEKIAQDFLLAKGYRIIAANFQTRLGEIDLIACHKKKLIFVEVKLKISDIFGTPEEMINKNKISQIQKTALSFLQSNPKLAEKYPFYRIDAVCITAAENGRPISINHYENIGDELA